MTDEDPFVFVQRHGTIAGEFSHLTQDSGNVSWLVETSAGRLFVKSAGLDQAPPAGAPVPYFDHAGRVRLLRNAIAVARSCRHPALPALRNVIESPSGPLLVYSAVEGELVGVPAARRDDPASAYRRLAALPSGDLFAVFDTLIDLHRSLADAGWVAGDLYDGCLIVDFRTCAVHVVDLDSYRRGPSTNDMGRMFGSTRFMAPEEFELGAPIDERTTVFTLGRLVWHFATRLTERADRFCGSPALASVVQRAVDRSRPHRYATVAAFADAWDRARHRAATVDR